MPKIKKIQVIAGEGCIPDKFAVDNIPSLLVITGKNNRGKSTFMRLVAKKKVKFLDEKDSDIKPTIVYVAAENILPSAGEAKSSAKTSALVRNLAELFAVLGVKLDLTERDTVGSHKDELFKLANENLKEFTGSDEHEMELNLKSKDQLDQAALIQLLLDKSKVREIKVKVPLDFTELGQGTQRVIIVSILKAYADMLNRQKGDKKPKLVLILFEEPEIYLHPELKRKLNIALKEIADRDNHQVIISTHDPYFAYTNMDEGGVKSFVKGEDGMTKPPEDGDSFTGVEDELLHIHLFTKVLENQSSGDTGPAAIEQLNQTLISQGIRVKPRRWGVMTSDKDLALPVFIRHAIHHPNTSIKEYNEDDLNESIGILSGILSSL